MRLLVTRPEPDATALKAQLIGLGHEVFVEPLMRVVFHALDELDLSDAQALIATSRNAVRAISRSPILDVAQAMPLYAVGPGTAATARALGFHNVRRGPGAASALVGFIAEDAQVNAGPLIHLAGEVKAVNVAGELRRLGFHVQEPVVYTVLPAERLSAPIVGRFEAGEIDGVLLLSPQTARTYARLIVAHGLREAVERTVHFCLSATVAHALAALAPVRVVAAAQPNLQALLALVARGVP